MSTQQIRIMHLEAGDVVLCHKEGGIFASPITRGIQILDRSPYNHAALYLGDRRVGQSTKRGLVEDPLEQLLEQETWIESWRLKEQPRSIQPVLDRANQYIAIGGKFAYNQLWLLAVLCVTRRLPSTPGAALLARRVLDRAAEDIEKELQEKADDPRERMICSEFVHRCFTDAALEIAVNPLLKPPKPVKAARTIEPGSVLSWAVEPNEPQVIAPPEAIIDEERPGGAASEDPAAGSDLAGLVEALGSDSWVGGVGEGPAKAGEPARSGGMAAPPSDQEHASHDHLRTPEVMDSMVRFADAFQRFAQSTGLGWEAEPIGKAPPNEGFAQGVYAAGAGARPSVHGPTAPTGEVSPGRVANARGQKSVEWLYLAASNWVTPGDLSRSPDLILRGRVLRSGLAT